jgi:hypothetical protein
VHRRGEGPDRRRIATIAIVAFVAGLLVWLLLIRDGGGTAPAAGAGPTIASEDDLVALAEELGHPIYWVGPQDDAELEVTRTLRGEVYVRYLTGGAEAGAQDPGFLTIGTYPFANASAALEERSEQEGALNNETPDGGLVVTNEENATSVYIAYPDEDLQIEVYDPDPERAFSVATSGDVVALD